MICVSFEIVVFIDLIRYTMWERTRAYETTKRSLIVISFIYVYIIEWYVHIHIHKEQSEFKSYALFLLFGLLNTFVCPLSLSLLFQLLSIFCVSHSSFLYSPALLNDIQILDMINKQNMFRSRVHAATLSRSILSLNFTQCFPFIVRWPALRVGDAKMAMAISVHITYTIYLSIQFILSGLNYIYTLVWPLNIAEPYDMCHIQTMHSYISIYSTSIER